MQRDIEFEERKKMYEDIKFFNRTELEELYRILCKCGEEVSENKNGMMIDLMNVKVETIKEIKKWITFCISNKASFETREKVMSDLANELKQE